MPPVCHLEDLHVCPMVTGVVPHFGGPIEGPGCEEVLVGEMPVSVMGDEIVCVGPPDMVALGFPTVLAGERPVTFIGSLCEHGGIVVGPGCPDVIVGG